MSLSMSRRTNIAQSMSTFQLMKKIRSKRNPHLYSLKVTLAYRSHMQVSINCTLLLTSTPAHQP